MGRRVVFSAIFAAGLVQMAPVAAQVDTEQDEVIEAAPPAAEPVRVPARRPVVLEKVEVEQAEASDEPVAERPARVVTRRAELPVVEEEQEAEDEPVRSVVKQRVAAAPAPLETVEAPAPAVRAEAKIDPADRDLAAAPPEERRPEVIDPTTQRRAMLRRRAAPPPQPQEEEAIEEAAATGVPSQRAVEQAVEADRPVVAARPARARPVPAPVEEAASEPVYADQAEQPWSRPAAAPTAPVVRAPRVAMPVPAPVADDVYDNGVRATRGVDVAEQEQPDYDVAGRDVRPLHGPRPLPAPVAEGDQRYAMRGTLPDVVRSGRAGAQFGQRTAERSCDVGRSARVQQQIRQKADDGRIDWRSAQDLEDELDHAEDIRRSYCASGLNDWREQRLEALYAQIEDRIRYEEDQNWRR